MDQQHISLNYGKTKLNVKIPHGLEIDVLSPNRLSQNLTQRDLLKRALDNPINSLTLASVPSNSRVVILVDDLSRPTPIGLMLPIVLNQLKTAGISQSQIKIAIALGTHRPMTRAELISRLGINIVSSYEIINESCTNEKEFIFIGTTRCGIPAWINRQVVEADFRIGMGSISPHTDAGFSGGGKIILPGICGHETITSFHSPQPGSSVRLGKTAAPLREDLERFVSEKISLDFILNVILGLDNSIYAAVAGHYIKAHRKGCEYAGKVYGIPVAHPYPIVVSNAYPTQIDLWQSTKALSSGALITKPGGRLILLTHCGEGVATHPHYAEYIGMKPEALLNMMNTSQPKDPVACALAYDITRLKKNLNIDLVSLGLGHEEAKIMGFNYFATIGSALENAMEVTGTDRAAIITHGGVCWPYVE